MNVLVVPGTTLIAKEIVDSLSHAKGIRIYGAGFDLYTALNFPYLAYDFLESLEKGSPLPKLEEIVFERKIDCIIFAHDSWIYNFRNLKIVGTAKVLGQLSSTIEIASFKSKTYDALRTILPTPGLYSSIAEIRNYPVFVKPDRGQGSVNSKRLDDFDEASQFVNSEGFFEDKWLVSEFLPGYEFTIDCFSNDGHEVIYSSVRKRLSIEFGVAIETTILKNEEMTKLARIIGGELQLAGPWFFQMKEDSDSLPKLMEVGLRVAGGSGVQRLKGVNFSKLQLFQSQGFELQIIDQDLYPSIFKNGFDLDFTYHFIYVDFDDTLIVDSKINIVLLNFLREQSLLNVEIILLTRHKGNLHESLEFYGLENLFDEVIHLEKSEKKSDFIECQGNFVFIDDSFQERFDVATKFNTRALVLDESFLQR